MTRPVSCAARLVAALAVLLVVALVLTVAGWVVLRDRGILQPSRFEPRCVATVADHTTVISNDQAWWTSIIVGESVRRGLPPRAASIAMATVYQETGIRNLDHGDRDSVGLFQQRPSQGWGTVEQIMDPYFATGRFYDALVKVDQWQSDDINDVAQQVQRSGHPEAYRDHEADGRSLASTVAGWTPAGFSCSFAPTPPDAAGLRAFVERTLDLQAAPDAEASTPDSGTPDSGTPDSGTLVYRTGSTERAWSLGHTAVATGSRFGTTTVQVADRIWTHNPTSIAVWVTVDQPLPEGEVRITLG